MADSQDIANWPPYARSALCLVAVVAAAERVSNIASGKPTLAAVSEFTNPENPAEHPLDAALFAAAADHSPKDWQALFPHPGLYRESAAKAVAILGGKSNDRQTPLYVFQLLALAERLAAQPAIRNALVDRLQQSTSPTPSELADIYRSTISKLGQRIQVSGDPATLRDERSAASIRALLLAGVRFAWLWRGLGGRRRHLVLGRRKLVNTIESIKGLLHE